MEDGCSNKRDVYLTEIRDLVPNLDIKTACLSDEGAFNDILNVNDTFIFKFPRSPDGIERLKTQAGLLEAIQGHVSLPIPSPHFVSEDMQTVGAAFIGYRILSGEPLHNHLDLFYTEAASRRLANQLATFLRDLHDFPTDSVGQILPVHDQQRREALPGTFRRVRESLYPYMRLDAQTLVTAQFDAFLNDPGSLDYGIAIKHGDLGPGNILVDPQAREICGIIDFGSAGLDDPAVDLGFISLWGEAFLHKSFVRLVYDSYGASEPLLRRVRFYKLVIALWVALDALQGQDQETFKMALGPYM
ncbi:MAG: phosphotransferase [Anaerolineae bacterium]|nr:phosphotransferase [Anaerolineae bacterium]